MIDTNDDDGALAINYLWGKLVYYPLLILESKSNSTNSTYVLLKDKFLSITLICLSIECIFFWVILKSFYWKSARATERYRYLFSNSITLY